MRRGLLGIAFVSFVSFVSFVVACGGAATRELTPWVRARRTNPAPTLMAESGGPRPTGIATEVRRQDGTWSAVSDDDCTLLEPHGRRVVVRAPQGQGWQLVDEHGRHMSDVPCGARVRMSPDGRAIVCLGFDGYNDDPRRAWPVQVAFFSADSRRAPRIVDAQIPAGSKAGPYFVEWLGFAHQSPVLEVRHAYGRDREQFVLRGSRFERARVAVQSGTVPRNANDDVCGGQ